MKYDNLVYAFFSDHPSFLELSHYRHIIVGFMEPTQKSRVVSFFLA